MAQNLNNASVLLAGTTLVSFLVLLFLTFLLNFTAVILRSRLRRSMGLGT